jgi:hypothetical protein
VAAKVDFPRNDVEVVEIEEHAPRDKAVDAVAHNLATDLRLVSMVSRVSGGA